MLGRTLKLRFQTTPEEPAVPDGEFKTAPEAEGRMYTDVAGRGSCEIHALP